MVVSFSRFQARAHIGYFALRLFCSVSSVATAAYQHLHVSLLRFARKDTSHTLGFPAVFGRGISASRTSRSTMPLRVSPQRVAISSRRCRASFERVI
jgi:hypothetical protein